MKSAQYLATFAFASLLHSAAGQPVLEVVSLKPHIGAAAPGALHVRPDGLGGDNLTLKQLVRYAFELQDVQILGPAWIETERFDIAAKAGSRIAPEQIRAAVQGILVDRFKLRSHREKKELPGYHMVVAATGPRLRDPKEEKAFNVALAGKPPFKEGYAGVFTNKDLPGFAERLSRGIGRLVVDDTGIKGRYWFQLEWVPDKGQTGIDGAALRAAIEDQLGLKLIEGNVLAKVFVIDSAARL